MGRNVSPTPFDADFFNGTTGTALATHNSRWASIGSTGTTDSYPVSAWSIRSEAGGQVCSTNAVQAAAGARLTGVTEKYRDICQIEGLAVTTPTADDIGICIQATSTRRGYHIRFGGTFTNGIPDTVTLYEDNGASTVQRAQNTSANLNDMDGGRNCMRLERCPDGVIRFYSNGHLELEWTDASQLTGGDPGFYKENTATAADAGFDHFIAGPSFQQGEWFEYPGGMRIRRIWTWYDDSSNANVTTPSFSPGDGSMLVLDSFSAGFPDSTTAVSGLDGKASWRPISGRNWGTNGLTRGNWVWAGAAGAGQSGTITITRNYSWRQAYSLWEVQGWDDGLTLEEAIVGARVEEFWQPPVSLYKEVEMRPAGDRHALSVATHTLYGGRPGSNFISEYMPYTQHGSSGVQVGTSIGGFASLAMQSYVGGPESFYLHIPPTSGFAANAGFRVFGRRKAT